MSSSSSSFISENLDKILKFDFANNVKIVLSKPQSGSLSKYIRIVADGFKKYNDVRQVLIGYKDYKELHDLKNILLPEVKEKKQSYLDSCIENGEPTDKLIIDSYDDIIKKYDQSITSKEDSLSTINADLLDLFNSDDRRVLSIVGNFKLSDVNEQIRFIPNKVEGLGWGASFYEYLCQFNDVECDMSSMLNLLDLSIDNSRNESKANSGAGAGAGAGAGGGAGQPSGVSSESATRGFFGQEMISRPRNAKSARGADAVQIMGDSIASHVPFVRKSKNHKNHKKVKLARRSGCIRDDWGKEDSRLKSLAIKGNDVQRDLYEKFPNLVISVSPVFFDQGVAQTVSECADSDLKSWLVGKDFLYQDRASAYNLGLALSGLLVAFEKAQVIHSDIKPANLLVMPDGTFRVCDFGYAHNRSDVSKGNVFCGTPVFMAPEVLSYIGPNFDFTSMYKKDFVSIAYTLMMVFGRPASRNPDYRAYSGREDAIRRSRKHYYKYGGHLGNGICLPNILSLPKSREYNFEIIETLYCLMSHPDYRQRGEALDHLKLFFDQWCDNVLKNETGVDSDSVDLLKAVVIEDFLEEEILILEAIAFNFQDPEFKNSLCLLLSNDCDFENIIYEFGFPGLKDDCEPLSGIDRDLDDIKQFVAYINSKASILSRSMNLRGVLEKRAFTSWKTWVEDKKSSHIEPLAENGQSLGKNNHEAGGSLFS